MCEDKIYILYGHPYTKNMLLEHYTKLGVTRERLVFLDERNIQGLRHRRILVYGGLSKFMCHFISIYVDDYGCQTIPASLID